MLNFLKTLTGNTSLFIRNLIHKKMEQELTNDNYSEYELRARTPYLYYAKLVRVIDGDTLILDVDLGFFITSRIKIRLNGINTPEINTNEGIKARDFVVKELTDCILVIETRKKEKYGRYLTYIYYHPTYDNYTDIIRYGKSITKELLKNDLATKYIE